MTHLDIQQQWITQAAAVRPRMLVGGGKAGFVSPKQVAGMTGLAIMQAMLAAACPTHTLPKRWTFHWARSPWAKQCFKARRSSGI